MAKRQKTPPGTWLNSEMAESKACLALKGIAPQLLSLFLLKRRFDRVGRKGEKKYLCTNSESISFTYIEAKDKYEITKSRFSRAIDELLAKGFITIIHRGGSFKQDKTIYGLSENWRIWQPGVVFEARERETVKRGFCKPNKKVTLENVPIHSRENVLIQEPLG
jgi:hypothetical protein